MDLKKTDFFIIQKCYLNFIDLNPFLLRGDVKLLNLIAIRSVARFDIQCISL